MSGLVRYATPRTRQRVLVKKIGQSNDQKRSAKNGLSAGNASYGDAYPNVQEVAQQDNSNTHDPQQWQFLAQQSMGAFTYDGGSGPIDCIGFEVSLMRDLDTAPVSSTIPRGFGGFAVSTFGVLGSSSGQWDPDGTYPTQPPGTPNLYSQFITTTKNEMIALNCSSLIIAWQHGEADALTVLAGTNYINFLGKFVDRLRADLGNIGPDGGVIPFFYARMNLDSPTGTYLGLSQLRASQDAFASARPKVFEIDMDSITQASGDYGGTHYNANGYVRVGRCYSPKMANACGLRIQPTASFTYLATDLSVAFTDTGVSPGDTIVSRAWTFGDGGTSTQQNPVHVYAGNGTFNVSVTETNSAGDTSTYGPIAISVSAGIPGVTRDATKGWYCPANATESLAFQTAIGDGRGAPKSVYDLQEDGTAGHTDAVDTGSAGITLTATTSPAPSYGVTFVDFTRKFVAFTDGVAKGFSSTSASLPDILTVSSLVGGILHMPAAAPAAARGVLALGTDASTRAALLIHAVTGKLDAESTTSHIVSCTNTQCDGTATAFLFMVDRTHNAVILWTLLDKITVTFGSTMTGRGFYLGKESALGSAAIAVTNIERWEGADAEINDSIARNWLQGKTGFTITNW